MLEHGNELANDWEKWEKYVNGDVKGDEILRRELPLTSDQIKNEIKATRH